MKISDAQFGALLTLLEHGPAVAEETHLPPRMDGTRRVRFSCHLMSPSTCASLERAGLITVARSPKGRPVNAFGHKGHPRFALRIEISDAGRDAIERA